MVREQGIDDTLFEILKRSAPSALSFLRDNGYDKELFKSLFLKVLNSRPFSKTLDKVFFELRKNSKSIGSNPNLTNLYVSIIRDFKSYMLSKNPNAYTRLEKNVRETGEPAIIRNMLPTGVDSTVERRTLKKIVRKHEPTNKGYTLSIDVAKRVREECPDEYKQYLKVKNDLKKAFDRELISFFRVQGQTLIDAKKVAKHMKAIDMPHNIQQGFVGQMDEAGNFYTVRGKVHPGRQLKTKPGGPCTMNKDYNADKDNTYVLKSKTPGAENETMFYTKDYGASSQVGKYQIVEDNIPLFEEARSKWIEDIEYARGEKFMYAVLCEVCYVSTARIGSRNETISKKGEHAGKNTYGIRTLACKHVKVEPDRIVLSYLGVKTSARLKHYIYRNTPHGKIMYDFIVSRKKAYKPNDMLFSYMGNPISPTKLNAYVKSLGLTITIHKFRTIRGTKIFAREVKKSKILSKDETNQPKQVEEEINRILMKVGDALGHYTTTDDGKKVTGSTALQYYIVPTRVFELYQKFNLRFPNNVKKLYDDMVKGKID